MRTEQLIPGSSIKDAKPKHTCSGCKADVLLGMIRDDSGTLRWRNFDLPAIEQGPHRFYRRHFCPKAPPTMPPPRHDRRLLDR